MERKSVFSFFPPESRGRGIIGGKRKGVAGGKPSGGERGKGKSPKSLCWRSLKAKFYNSVE
nr:MAG TPA: hypothetical protein [Caudoviricetes sp.]